MNRTMPIPGLQFPDAYLFPVEEVTEMMTSMAGKSCQELHQIIEELPSHLNTIHGQVKNDANVQDIFTYFTRSFIKNKEFLPVNYRYFGSDEPLRLLVAFVRSNPFFASTLKAVYIDKVSLEFHINAYDPLDCSWFCRFVETYDPMFPRVNAVFDAQFQLKSFQAYSVDRSSMKFMKVAMKEEEAISRLLFLMTYYFQSVHALIHIHHVLMVSALNHATKGTLNLAPFVRQYRANLYVKYLEVKFLLLAENAGLTGRIYRGDRDKLLPLMGELMQVWGSCQSVEEFLSRFLLKDLLLSDTLTASKDQRAHREKLLQSDILTEFWKHADLVSPFAYALDKVFRLDADDYAATNKGLTHFLEHTGVNGPRVNSLQGWLEIMTLTGILHGAAQSGTRLCSSISVLRYFHEDRMTFDMMDLDGDGNDDAVTLLILLGTMVGITDGHDVFNNLMFTERSHPLIQGVMDNYGGQSSAYKMMYWERISSTSEFSELGWIWTDYCPDMIDNKQFTITAYV
jgi:hypothetical protein